MSGIPGRPWTDPTDPLYHPPEVQIGGANGGIYHPGSVDVNDVVQGSVSEFPATSSLDNIDSNLDSLLQSLATRAQKGDEAAMEKLFNYYATVKSEKTARDWTASREDNQYQRLMADLQKAGISPYIMSSAVPGVSAASSSSFSGSQLTSKQSNERTTDTSMARALISLVGTAIFIIATML